MKITHGQYLKQIAVPYNGKIADITHADTNKHTLNLATALTETRKIIAGVFDAVRIGGIGAWRYYSNEGVNFIYADIGYRYPFVIIADGTQRLQYDLTVANDDFDLYCFGYVVEVTA